MRISVYIALCISFICFTCKKVNVPEDVEGTPVFSFNGVLDSSAIDILVGEEGYVMRTNSEVDTSGVTIYTGTLEPLSCCNAKLRFIFRDSSETNPSSAQSLVLGDYNYLIPITPTSRTVYNVQFNPIFESNASISPNSFFWNFGDGSNSTDNQPLHVYEDESEDRIVRLAVSSQDGCTAEIEKTINLNSVIDCPVDFNLFSVQQGFGIEAMIEPASPLNPNGFSYWLWGDSLNDSTIFYTVFPELGVADQICVSGQLASDGCMAEICKGVYITGQPQPPFVYCEANFTYSVQPEEIIEPAPDQLGTVIVEYEDEQGQIFTSALGPQDIAQFTVLSIEPYQQNEDGMPTQKLSLQMECKLYDATGTFAFNLSGDAVIAVGAPD